MMLGARNLAMAAAAALAAALAGCKTGPPDLGRVERGPPPAFGEVVSEYNARIEGLESFISAVVVRIEYVDEDGKRRVEQGDGVVQFKPPSRFALSVNKAGVRILWIGCDDQRYWWLDLDQNVARVGRHELVHLAGRGDGGEGGAGGGGLGFSPRELPGLLGLTPINAAEGAVQWSSDGRLLGITAPAGGGDGGGGGAPGHGRLRRTWIDPDSLMAVKIELYGADGEPELIADLEGSEVLVLRSFLRGPKVRTRVKINHPASETFVRLNMASPREGPVSDDAFDLEHLIRVLGVERVVDLDAGPSAPADER